MKPKVLITIDWFLPGTKSGGPVRSYANLMDHLSEEIDFYVLTRDTDYCEDEPYDSVVPNTWQELQPGVQVYYLSRSETTRKGISKVLRTQTFDVVLVNGMYSWYFSILPLWVMRQHPRLIISARGMLNTQAFSVKPFKKKIYLALAKALGLFKGHEFHATNATEAEQIRRWIGKYTVVNIAANLPRKSHRTFQQKAVDQPISLVNVARIAKEKGTLILLETLAKVSSPLELDMYGSIYDEAYWSQCQEQIKALPAHIKVQYCGVAKSEEVPEILAKYHGFIMLSEGENFGHSILEALSVGLPVIISNKTPWVNLRAQQVGWDVSIDDEQVLLEVFEEFAKLDQETYNTMSKTAYNFAQKFINDSKVLEANKNLFLS